MLLVPIANFELQVPIANFVLQAPIANFVLQVPIGGCDRLQNLPSLIGREFTVEGLSKRIASADVTLSSLGELTRRIS